jgi:hypothetical protein
MMIVFLCELEKIVRVLINLEERFVKLVSILCQEKFLRGGPKFCRGAGPPVPPSSYASDFKYLSRGC